MKIEIVTTDDTGEETRLVLTEGDVARLQELRAALVQENLRHAGQTLGQVALHSPWRALGKSRP